jgi:hypothetical protein
MSRWLKEIWIGSEPVEFESEFGMVESVARLKAATRRWGAFTLTKNVATGTVTQSRVLLERKVPMVSNPFKPVFHGRFETIRGKTLLTGRFTPHWFVRLFIVTWPAFCVLANVLPDFADESRAQLLPELVISAGMMAAGLAVMLVIWSLSRDDPAWLSDVINNALLGPAALPTPDMRAKSSKTGPQKFILVVTSVLALGGLIACALAIANIQSYSSGPTGSVVTHYADTRSRYLVAGYGVAMLALSFGIYRRQLLAWRFGFVFVLGSGALQVFEVLSGDEIGHDRIGEIAFCIFAIVVAAVWSRWWHAQRDRFGD